VEKIRVPEGINAVLAARLDLLPEAERGALQAASVVGERFRAGEVQTLLGISNVEPDLDSLRRKGLVAGGDMAGEEYRFKHLLIRDATYASLPKSGRARFHDQFRAVLETTYGDPEQITEIIAYHAERSFALSNELGLDQTVVVDRARHAIRWLFAMAERLRTRYDEPTLHIVLGMLRSAVAAVPPGEDPSIQPRMKLLEAQLLLFRADYLPARQAAAEAAVLAEAADMPRAVATARLIVAWTHNWAQDGGISKFQEAVDRAVAASRRAGDLPLEIEARHLGSNILWNAGDVVEFVRVNEELVRLAESIGDNTHVAWITARLVGPEHQLGNNEKAHGYRDLADALAAKYGLRNVAMRVMFDRAWEAMDAGDLERAERLYRETHRTAVEAGARQQEMMALRWLGLTLVWSGRPGKAIEVLDNALRLSLESGERWNRSEVLAMRARAALDAGDMEGADEFIASAVESVRPDDVSAVSEVNTALGLIRSTQHRDAEAEVAFRLGLEIVADTGFFTLAATAAVSLAVFLAGHGAALEAKALGDKYRAMAHGRDMHFWDAQFAEVDDLFAANS
jgi:tetratricopeptide (TPR) repeat protein